MFRGFVFLLLLLLLSSKSQPTTVLVGNHVSRLFITIAGRCLLAVYKVIKIQQEKKKTKKKTMTKLFPTFGFHGSYCLIPLFSFLFSYSSFISSHFHSSFLISLISFLLSHSSFINPLFRSSFFILFVIPLSSFLFFSFLCSHSSFLIPLFSFLISHSSLPVNRVPASTVLYIS